MLPSAKRPCSVELVRLIVTDRMLTLSCLCSVHSHGNDYGAEHCWRGHQLWGHFIVYGTRRFTTEFTRAFHLSLSWAIWNEGFMLNPQWLAMSHGRCRHDGVQGSEPWPPDLIVRVPAQSTEKGFFVPVIPKYFRGWLRDKYVFCKITENVPLKPA
jgi:hypothetical protein